MKSTRIDVVKSGERQTEEFDPGKLHRSIAEICRCVRTPDGQAEEIAKRVTVGVMQWCESRPEITSSDIRRTVIRLLKPLHAEAAYLYEQHKSIM